MTMWEDTLNIYCPASVNTRGDMWNITYPQIKTWIRDAICIKIENVVELQVREPILEEVWKAPQVLDV